MSSDQPTEYDLLTPEEAAQIDAVCDRFERAWKATMAGGPVPCLASYTSHGHGAARDVLLQELTGLDRVCRERYGLTVRPQDSEELGILAAASAIPATHSMRPGADVPAAPHGGWPNIPGLEFVSVLGSGGMGLVVKARQATLDRDVAVKFLHDAHRGDPEQRERFLQEARAVARLRHPHLVQVYEFGEVPAAGGAMSQPYLVLEYVSGGSLADRVHGSPQPPGEAARLVEMVADAIHYAHQQGVIHRDLKPANILLQSATINGDDPTERMQSPHVSHAQALTADLCPKVTDFGLAKLLAGSDLTRTGYLLGTPSYMAPEQTGKSVLLTAAVDVYGLGAILYEALTGRPPFAAGTAEATVIQVRHDDPVPPRRLQPTVPRDLETICLKCLRKEPGRRYASAQELADDLRRFRAGEPIRARPLRIGERVVVWCRRKPVVAGLLAALVFIFLAGSFGVLWQWQSARRNAAEAVGNAAEAKRERDIARQEKERAEHHLQMVCDRADRLNQLGSDLLQRPGQYRTGKAVLEQALGFYQDMLPEDLNDPRVRQKAAQLYAQVAGIHSTLGQADEAAKAWGHRATLLAGLLEEKPTDKELRLQVADSHRYRATELRGLGKAREAREAYDQAERLHQELLREFPNDGFYQVALANTLLNSAILLSRLEQREEIEALYGRILELFRTAVRGAPDNPRYKAELALGLMDQGMFLLDTGRGSRAETAVREALEIHQRLLAGGHLKGYIEPYAARNFVILGQVLAATGRAQEAEKPYREAVNLLDQLVKKLPEAAHLQIDLAHALAGLADLIRAADRRYEAEEIFRRVARLYETLRANSPGVPAVNNEVAWFLATCPEPRFLDPALAVRLAKEAVNAQPESFNYRNTLGVAHFRKGDDKAAIAELGTAMDLRRGGDSSDWFFLAMAHWRIGDRDKAQMWFDRAVQWMEKNKPHDDELRRFRAEAEALLADVRRR